MLIIEENSLFEKGTLRKDDLFFFVRVSRATSCF